MNFRLEVKENGEMHLVGNDISMRAFASVMGQAIGKVASKTAKLEVGQDMMDILEELGDKVIIPSFLEGAGCRLKEETDG